MRQRRDSREPVGAGAEAQRFLERAKTITPTPWLRSHSRNGAGTAAARIAALAQAGLDARGRPFGPFCAREDRVSAFADPVMPLDGRIRPRSGWGRSVPTSTPISSLKRPFVGKWRPLRASCQSDRRSLRSIVGLVCPFAAYGCESEHGRRGCVR